MYDKIKKDIEQGYYLKNYPNDGQRFIAWYLRNIHNLDTFEAKSCITDGAGDKQVDAVYVDNSEPLREVLASWIQIKKAILSAQTWYLRTVKHFRQDMTRLWTKTGRTSTMNSS